MEVDDPCNLLRPSVIGHRPGSSNARLIVIAALPEIMVGICIFNDKTGNLWPLLRRRVALLVSKKCLYAARDDVHKPCCRDKICDDYDDVELRSLCTCKQPNHGGDQKSGCDRADQREGFAIADDCIIFNKTGHGLSMFQNSG